MLNRIIGILVVLALAILVYPFIYSSPESFFGRNGDNINTPPFPSPQTQNATIKALDHRNEGSIMKGKAARFLANVVLKEKKHLFKNVAWVVQVGLPQEKGRALSLVNQLRAKGYNAFIQQKKAAFGEEVQIFIGPEAKQESAAFLAAKLAKETKLSGVVKAYKQLSA